MICLKSICFLSTFCEKVVHLNFQWLQKMDYSYRISEQSHLLHCFTVHVGGSTVTNCSYQQVQLQPPAGRASACTWQQYSFVIAVSGLHAYFCTCISCMLVNPRDHTEGRDRESSAPAHGGRNSFLESYTSRGIWLMSTKVERCIEYVRSPLAMRCGQQITSQSVTAHSVSQYLPFLSPASLSPL